MLTRLLCGIAIFIVLLFTAVALFAQDGRNQARATVVNGYPVFVMSWPVQPFTHVGTVVMQRDTAGSERLAFLLQQTRDSVPAADAVIIPSLAFDTVYFIHFK